ncbi:MAG: DUF1566 domain-containing protein [Desulfobulbaceae bacterium]|nr:DUF1566 domain-containing protein [Desulfobulbaceae bacterium]
MKQALSILTIATVLLIAIFAFAAPSDLAQTGQTKCYNASQIEIDCSGTGQDGEYQKGVAWPSPRFTDNGDGTVTDNLTGLVWLHDGNCPQAVRSWYDALADINQINNDGTMNANDCNDTSNNGGHQTDWRLPNILELESLVDLHFADVAFPSPNPFNARSPNGAEVVNKWWSGTTDQADTLWSFYLDFEHGEISSYSKTAGSYYVWPVRGNQNGGLVKLPKTGQKTCYGENRTIISCAGTGQDGELQQGVTWPTPRFADNADGTVTDNLTGLIWLKNGHCYGSQTWEEALTSATGLANNTCGLTDSSSIGDWRLPNRRELQSLVDFENKTPSLPDNHPFINVPTNESYWSSSTGTPEFHPDWAWYIFFNRGTSTITGRGNLNGVWMVRDATGGPYDLTVNLAGSGKGSVTSSPAGIDCGADCSESYAVVTTKGETVTLSATTDPGYIFTGWSGSGCFGTDDCTVTIDHTRSVTATFSTKAPWNLFLPAILNNSQK